jgi:hypothetical protein
MRKSRYPLSLFLALATAIASAGHATEDPPASVEANISGNVKIAAAAAKRDAKVVKAVVEEGAGKVGVEAKTVAHQVANATKIGVHEVSVAAKEVAVKTKAAEKSNPVEAEKKPAQ